MRSKVQRCHSYQLLHRFLYFIQCDLGHGDGAGTRGVLISYLTGCSQLA